MGGQVAVVSFRSAIDAEYLSLPISLECSRVLILFMGLKRASRYPSSSFRSTPALFRRLEAMRSVDANHCLFDSSHVVLFIQFVSFCLSLCFVSDSVSICREIGSFCLVYFGGFDWFLSVLGFIVLFSDLAKPLLTLLRIFRMKWLPFKGCSLVFVAFEFKLMAKF